MTFIMRKKKYKFNVTITVEQLSSVPFMNEVLFVKCRLLNGGSFVYYTDRVEVVDHCVKWNKCFVFTCKMSANASTGLLDSCILRLSLRKETKDGKSYDKMGYHDLNLSSFAGAGITNCRCLLEGYESRHHRQDNSLLHFKVDMKLLAGDPCFKTPAFNCLTEQQKQGSNDFLLDTELNASNRNNDSNDVPLPDGLPIVTESDLNHLHSDIMLNNSASATNTMNTISTGSNNNSANFHYYMDLMTSSATSNTNSVGSAFEPFETGNSRSTSSQTSSSRMSTGYNSLPSHSRQGSADSENTATTRYQNEVKFNSVDRVGNKRNVHTKPVNGGLHEDLYLTGSSKKALDSTRISADQLVQELLKTNKLDETTFQENTFTNDANGGGVLELFVGKDGSATISGRPSRPGKDVSTKGNEYPVLTNSSSFSSTSSRRINRV